MMTVKELIERLKKENPDSPVAVTTKIWHWDEDGDLFDGGDEEINPVTEIKYDCTTGQVVIL